MAGGSDGALANLGSGAGEDDAIAITVGTSGAIRAIVDQPLVDHGDALWCYNLWPGRWLVGGAINNGGLALNWVAERFYYAAGKDGPGKAETFNQMFLEAGKIEAGADGVTMLPWFTGERSPRWQPNATAGLIGLTLNHTRAHIARAAMEAVTFCLADVFDSLPPEIRGRPFARLTGGITRSPLWMQILADVLNIHLQPTEAADASALGAAAIAWSGIAGESPLRFINANRSRTGLIKPNQGDHQRYKQARRRFIAHAPLSEF